MPVKINIHVARMKAGTPCIRVTKEDRTHEYYDECEGNGYFKFVRNANGNTIYIETDAPLQLRVLEAAKCRSCGK